MKSSLFSILVLSISTSAFAAKSESVREPFNDRTMKKEICEKIADQMDMLDPTENEYCMSREFTIVKKVRSERYANQLPVGTLTIKEVILSDMMCSAEIVLRPETIYVDKKGDLQKKRQRWAVDYVDCDN